MSYLGGRHVVSVLNAHYPKAEDGVWLTCQSCGVDDKLDLPHSTSNEEIVAAFRSLGWDCDDSGHKAKCPKCAAHNMELTRFAEGESGGAKRNES